MARTADYVVRKVLDMLVIGAAEASIEASDAQAVIDYMNDYMASLDALGIDLGYTEVDNLGDLVTVPAGAIRGVIANVAIAVAPSYNIQITPGLALQGRAGLKAMRRLTSGVGPTQYPSTLPRGSGNTGNSGFTTDRFYPDLQNDILAETTGSIGLETNTAEETP